MPRDAAMERKPPRLMRFGSFLKVYPWGKTKAYDLIGAGRLRAVKLDGMTLIDLDSADALLASLPEVRLVTREAA